MASTSLATNTSPFWIELCLRSFKDKSQYIWLENLTWIDDKFFNHVYLLFYLVTFILFCCSQRRDDILICNLLLGLIGLLGLLKDMGIVFFFLSPFLFVLFLFFSSVFYWYITTLRYKITSSLTIQRTLHKDAIVTESLMMDVMLYWTTNRHFLNLQKPKGIWGELP